eukprot:CAMPEP_0172668790 /NCGR_PEP_ID=MMETSP1074-20121228/9275_1 /TAXON_ID=2916 /ORGANISM="Ceratium fusus, Strain PA161109" /LENGTH=355 /DNA_ID=CAMNT_0013485477 /DNA_START=70 /DNA_END=1137 /DNA_ORIENTATION=+
MLLTIILVFCAADEAQSAPVRACYTGYVMDKFCINRGTLLDNPSIVTLEEPDKHTVHCLVDVSACFNSGYEILAPGSIGGTPYTRAFELDSPGNANVIALARETGDCSTCTGNGMLKAGFSATVVGTYDSEELLPRPIKVERLERSSIKCADLGVEVANVTGELRNDDKLYQLTLAHGSLMITSWGFILPMGVAVAKFLRHRDPLWFKIHRACQMIGLIVAIAGAIIAFTQFNVFQAGYPAKNLAHGTMGAIIMTLGILQPINAFFRPHKEKGHPQSRTRYVWEVLHKGSGYFALCLTVPTIVIGTMLVRPEHSPAFQTAYGVLVVFMIFAIIMMVCSRKRADVEVSSGVSDMGT